MSDRLTIESVSSKWSRFWILILESSWQKVRAALAFETRARVEDPAAAATERFSLLLKDDHPGFMQAMLRAAGAAVGGDDQHLPADRISVTGTFLPMGGQPIRLLLDYGDPLLFCTGAVIPFRKLLKMKGDFEISICMASGSVQTNVILRQSHDPDRAESL